MSDLCAGHVIMSNASDATAGAPALPKVPEYDAAGKQFIWDLLLELMRAKDPILEMIPRQPVDHVSMEGSAPRTSAVAISPALYLEAIEAMEIHFAHGGYEFGKNSIAKRNEP